MFADVSYFSLRDNRSVNRGACAVVRRPELGGASVFSWGPAPRRFATWPVSWLVAFLVVAAAVALLAVAVSVGVANARGPGGGYYETYPDRGRWGSGLADLQWVARTPLRWLRQSSRSFQSLMRLLAERSTGAEAPPPPLQLKRPRKEAVEEVEEPPRRSVYGGEAGAGRDRGTGGARVKEWHRTAKEWTKDRQEIDWPRPSTSCRRAGVPVRRGGWYVVQKGDTLWRIAEAHYGYGEAYLRLHRANRERVPEADLIYPCQRLYIPRWRCCGLGDRSQQDHAEAPPDGDDDGDTAQEQR
jgi:LysM domain-containing protein